MATRNILNISLPAEMARFVKREAKERKFSSVSEFVRSLLREYEERTVLADLEESWAEFEAGEAKVLRSLSDLDPKK